MRLCFFQACTIGPGIFAYRLNLLCWPSCGDVVCDEEARGNGEVGDVAWGDEVVCGVVYNNILDDAVLGDMADNTCVPDDDASFELFPEALRSLSARFVRWQS
jgi:hypothetical protein